MDAIQFEPMSIGGILDKTFTLYRRNFLRFVTIVAVIQVPVMLFVLVWMSLVQRTIGDFPTGNHFDSESMGAVLLIGVGYFGIVIASLVGKALCQGALVRSVSDAYLGNEISVGQTYRSVLPKLMTLIAAGLLVGLVVACGFLLLVVPGVIFHMWFCLTMPSIIVENHGVLSAMSRSKLLVSGNLGKTFMVIFLAWVVTLIVTAVVTFPITMAGNLVVKFFFPQEHLLILFINQFGSLIGQVLAMPIASAASILLYYDLRIRKEGFDLQMLAQSMASNQG